MSVDAFRPPPGFENVKLMRTVDLTGSYVKESVAIDVKNVGDKPLQNYYYALNSVAKKNIGVIEGRESKKRVSAVNVELYGEEDTEKYVQLTTHFGLGS